MAKKKQSTDVNVTAFEILQEATQEGSKPRQTASVKKATEPKKNPAAVALGRLGGLKGGKARAAKLSISKRKEIAKKAARIRWSKNNVR